MAQKKTKPGKAVAAPAAGMIATAENSPLAWTYGTILRPEDDILTTRGRGKGLKIYDDLERDPHVFAVIQKRKLSVIAREWRVDAASEAAADVAVAEFVKTVFKSLAFDQICLALLDSILKGFAVVEIDWQNIDGYWLPKSVEARDQRNFVFDKEKRLRLLTSKAPFEGMELDPRKFITHSSGSKNGDPYGLGIGSRLFWPVFFKRQGLSFWLTFAEKFGTPTAVGKFPKNTSDDQQIALLEALRSLARELAIVMPKDVEIEYIEAQRNGTIDTYAKLVNYQDDQISEAVLGETLTTNIKGEGSRAATETHNEVRLEISKADADLLSDTLNQTLIKYIVELNFPTAKLPTVWRIFTEKEDLEKRAKIDNILMANGYRPADVSYINDTYGSEWVDTKVTPKPEKPAEFAEGDKPPRDSIDKLVSIMRDEYAEKQNPYEAVRLAIESATSFEDLKDKVKAAVAGLKDEELIDLLTRGIFNAELAGRLGLPKING